MKKVLILGSTGMLGHILYHYLESMENFELHNLSYRNSLNTETIIQDVTDSKELSKSIKNIRPDIIINCIGVLINGANRNPKNAIYLNAYFPHWLLDISNKLNFKLIHISTDCVFSGKTGNYTENSIKDALDIYGKTKSLGEFNDQKHLCLRTSIIGPEIKKKGEGLFHWLLNQSGDIFGFKNVYWSGITTLELSKAIHFSINNNISGIWNLTNGKSITKYQLLKTIIDCFNLTTIDLNENLETKSNKSLLSIRDISYKIPDYLSMIKELKLYMEKNKILYDYKF